jgi:hypothetical protein
MTSATVLDGHASRRPAAPSRSEPLALGPVATTMMIPLWARAAETRKRHPLVRDVRAAEICESVDFDFGTFRYSYGTFERIDNGTARWVDVDLPDAIALRRAHFTPTSRRTFLSASVLDPVWPLRNRARLDLARRRPPPATPRLDEAHDGCPVPLGHR